MSDLGEEEKSGESRGSAELSGASPWAPLLAPPLRSCAVRDPLHDPSTYKLGVRIGRRGKVVKGFSEAIHGKVFRASVCQGPLGHHQQTHRGVTGFFSTLKFQEKQPYLPSVRYLLSYWSEVILNFNIFLCSIPFHNAVSFHS